MTATQVGIPATLYPHLAPRERPVEHLNRRRRTYYPWTAVRIPDTRAAALDVIVDRTGSTLYTVVNALLQACLDEPGLIDELIAQGAFPVSDKVGRPRKDRNAGMLKARAAVVDWLNAPSETRGRCPHPELVEEIKRTFSPTRKK